MTAVNVVESGPSTVARYLTSTVRATLRPALQAGVHAAHLPWPFGALELAAGFLPARKGTNRTTVRLPRCTADLIRAKGVSRRTGKVILYCHGGAFLVCGVNTHADLVTRLSRFSNAPVFAPNYRMIPGHSVGAAIEDCLDAYEWLRRDYEPHEIVLAGDSAGGYLALSVATHLQGDERPAGLALLSPLLQLDPAGRKAHPNIRCDAMFGAPAFDALIRLIKRANGGLVYEPLDDLTPDLPPVVIHVSGHEALLHDARLAAARLSDLCVPVEVTVWPGQMHVFQIAPFVPEANRSLRQIAEFVVACTENVCEYVETGLTNRTATVG